jgi:hypothetical protein
MRMYQEREDPGAKDESRLNTGSRIWVLEPKFVPDRQELDGNNRAKG